MDSLSERLLLSSMDPDVLVEECSTPPLPPRDGDDADVPLWRVLMTSRFKMACSISLRFE